ncbi:hypothetical protein GCM10009838_19000 [Catenulispora subtropica]|uniref:Uncharacterized protein n=2 Tax=Catenulispora subtropica TaxID=450798 RepID=A0ABN2R2L1_9ACTN
MAAGLLLVGLSGYVFLAVTGHSSTPSNAAALSSLYFLAGLVTLGVFVGLEQETSRATSRAMASGRRLAPVARRARRHTVWLLALTLAVLAVLSPALVAGPLRGQWALFGALMLAAGAGAACYWVRGLLGGRQQFHGYAATLATEGLGRLVPCVALFVATGQGGAAWAYGVAFAAAQGLAAGAGWWWLREGFEVPGTDPVDTEISEFESGERSAAGGLALLVTGSLLTQVVANLPPLAASTRLQHSDAVAAAFGQAFVLVRIPLLLISPIQAMLLPDLTRSAARGDHAALKAKVRLALAAVAGLGVAGTALLAVAGPWVLRVFFGTKADLSHALLAVLGIGTVFLMAAAILQPTLVALNGHRLVPMAWGAGAVVSAVLVELPVDPLHAAAAGGVGGPVTVVAVMAGGLAGALRRARGDATSTPGATGATGTDGSLPDAVNGAIDGAARDTTDRATPDTTDRAAHGAIDGATHDTTDRAAHGTTAGSTATAEMLWATSEAAPAATAARPYGAPVAMAAAMNGPLAGVPGDAPGAAHAERRFPLAGPGAGGASWQRTAARAGKPAAEVVAALVAAFVMVFAARYIAVDPLARTGQVSALAALQLRFAVLGIALLAVLVFFHRRGRGYDTAKRVVCAAVAGLASGFLGGGVVVALRGTPWPLFGLSGDTGRLVEWSASIVHGHGNPNPTYPPLTLHALAWWAQLFHHGDTAAAFRDFEIGGAALTGPAAYLAWRLVLSPLWALVVGVVPAYAIIDPYKPYGAIVMIVLLPVFVASVRHTTRVGDLSWRRVLASAVLFGLLYSILFLTYPGSSLWSAPGLMAAVFLLFPWSKHRVGKLAAFVGATLAVFGILCGWYVNDLLGPGTVDRAYGFDAYTDPAFFSMWRTDMPGDVGQWPPPGELAGVGLFSILTFAGLGVALWLGWRRPLAVTVACVFAGTWLWRMEVASRMWATGTVQLWPRTGNQLLYCVLVLGAAAACFAASRLGSWPPSPARLGAHVGALAAALLVLGTAASSASDYWMPAKTNSYKILAYVAQTMRKPDGTCPTYAPDHACSDTGDQSWLNNFAPPRNH